MVQAVDTRLTTVNGYSGLFPDQYEFLANVMYGYPNERGDAALRRYGVRYLVVSTDWMRRDPRRPRWLAARHRKLVRGRGDRHLRVPMTGDACAQGDSNSHPA